MFLLMVLILTIVFLALFAALTLAIGGTAFVIVFGDIIVCIAVIIWIIKKIQGRKRK